MTYKKMIRYWRIFKIRTAGKFIYLKRFSKWRRGQLLRDLQLLTPAFHKSYTEKYGDQNFTFLMEQLGKEPIELRPPPQMAEFKDGEMIIRDATPDEISKPVTITLTNNYNQ